MRVALVYRNFSMEGSIERDVVLLAKGLVRRGVEVHCYCNPAARTVDVEGVEFHDVEPLVRSRARLGRPLETASFAAAATRAIRRDRSHYDVVDVTGVSAWEGDVVTVHGVTKALQRRWPDDAGRGYRGARLRAALSPALRPQIAVARAIERAQFRSPRGPRAIAVTEEVRRDLVEVHGLTPNRVDVIAPPIVIRPFRARDRGEVAAELGLGPADSILLFVGHDFARKGLDTAIGALAGLEDDVHLVVVGGGRRGQYQALAAGAGVGDRVHFVGPTERPEAYFAAADLYVMPTLQDPWGITIIEALAAGVPVVTSSAAGASAIVRSAEAGIVLDDVSANDVRQAVAGLLGNPARRSELGARGPAAAEPFGLDRHVDLVLGAYERTLAERRPLAITTPSAEAA